MHAGRHDMSPARFRISTKHRKFYAHLSTPFFFDSGHGFFFFLFCYSWFALASWGVMSDRKEALAEWAPGIGLQDGPEDAAGGRALVWRRGAEVLVEVRAARAGTVARIELGEEGRLSSSLECRCRHECQGHLAAVPWTGDDFGDIAVRVRQDEPGAENHKDAPKKTDVARENVVAVWTTSCSEQKAGETSQARVYRTSDKPKDFVVIVEVDLPPAQTTLMLGSEEHTVQCGCSHACSGHLATLPRGSKSKGTVAVSVQALHDPIADTSNDMMANVTDVMFNQSTDLSDPPSIEAMRKDSGRADRSSMGAERKDSGGGTDSESSLNSSSIDATNGTDYESISKTIDGGNVYDILLHRWEKRKRDKQTVWTQARRNSNGEVEYAIRKDDPKGEKPSTVDWFETPSAALLNGGFSNGNPYSLWKVPTSLAGRKTKAGAKKSSPKSKSGANSNND